MVGLPLGVVFLLGAVLQMIADYDVLLAGRFITGMGVGASSMLPPPPPNS